MRLDDYTEQLDSALVGPRDNRIHIIETTRFPFNTVCHLARNYGSGYRFGCSGVLVAPRLLMTAAHCIFSRRRGQAPLRMAVCPGRRDRHSFPFGCIVTGVFYVPRAFIKRDAAVAVRKRHDFGFVVLPRAFANLRRYPAVEALSRAALTRLKSDGLIGISGYPGDRPQGTMWYHKERLKRAARGRLYYTVDTCPGHSGSPIWVAPGGDRRVRVIGIHTSGILDDQGRSYGCRKDTILAPAGLLNSGVQVTPRMAAAARSPTPAAFRSLGMVRVGGSQR